MLSCEFGVGVCVWGVGGDSGRDKIQKNIVLFAFSDTLVFNCFFENIYTTPEGSFLAVNTISYYTMSHI